MQALLVCPRCRHALIWLDERCNCDFCGVEYSITQGVPRLMGLTAAESLSADRTQAENARLRAELSRHRWLGRLIDLMRPPLPYDRYGRWVGQRAFDDAIARQPGRTPLVLDLGSGQGRDEELRGLSDPLRLALIRTDIRADGPVDFVSDAHAIPMTDNALDGVIFQGVAEHVARPWLIAAEIVRVLKPGGVVFAEAPFIQWYHEDPKDYYRFTQAGLEALFEGCARVQSGVAIGPVGGVIGVARELLPMLFSQRHLSWSVKWAMAWLTYPLIVFDRLYRRRPRAKTTALAVYLVARKR